MRLSGNRRYSTHNWDETREAAPNQAFYKCGLITPTLEVVGSNPVSRTKPDCREHRFHKRFFAVTYLRNSERSVK